MKPLLSAPSIKQQHGAAFIVMLVIMIMGVTAFLVSSLKSNALQIKRDEVTAEALAQAKEALMGYAVSVNLTGGIARPGDLPCPDTNNDGVAENSCGSASGSNQAQRLGRLPWKTLGLSDLRDGNGERLWYAVSNNFKEKTHTICSSPGQPGCLNSDTAGTITIRSPDGNLVFDASVNNGVAAIIISPGVVLQRTDKGSAQDRSNAGVNLPENYLDIALGEDNANFADGLTDGFIQGPIKDSSGNVILNDQFLVITQDNIMQPIQKRVASEVKLCLNEYAGILQNRGRYPWAAPLSPAPVSYADSSDGLFGRIPDQTFDNTKNDSGDVMLDVWGGNCNVQYGTWWLNWKEMVFYGLADAYKPVDPLIPPSSCAVGTCLSVNPPSATVDKNFVIIVAGKALPGQARGSNSEKGTLGNYLEAPNSSGATTFSQSHSTAAFNDTTIFQ